MRVLHLGKYYPPYFGGIERFLADLVSAQRRTGIEAAALVHEGGHRPKTPDPPWILRVPVWFNLVFAPISPAFPIWLNAAIQRLRPQILHLHLPNLSAFWVLLVPAARLLPWVVHWHSDVIPSKLKPALRISYHFYRPLEQALLERADKVIATSRAYRESSDTLRPWSKKCHVIPLGIDFGRLPSLMPTSGHNRLWRRSTRRILSIGRLTYYKGQDTLIRAISRLPDSELIIVGDGDERDHLHQVINDSGCSDRVRLLGGVDDETCRSLLATCDIFALASRERTEAFGIVLMEAMRYARPIVASRIEGSGVSWVVQDGQTGLLLPVDDVEAWYVALQHLLDDVLLRRRLGEAGRRRCQTEFDIRISSRSLTEVYRTLSLSRCKGSSWGSRTHTC